MPKPTLPTIADVARLAGVSPMTVSRVINGRTSVGEHHRKAVLKAIKALGYKPNSAARALAGRDLPIIGLLYYPQSGYLSDFLVGALSEVQEQQAQLIIEMTEPGREVAVAKKLLARGVNAFVVPPPFSDAPELRAWLIANTRKAVLVGSVTVPPELIGIRIDESDAAAMVTRHLLYLGHRRIGFIQGNPRASASAARLAGFRLAMEEAGISLDEKLVVPGLFNFRSGLEAARQLLSAKPRPTAIFASNDDMAAAVVAVAHSVHLEVPTDLSVCGFDDTVYATSMWPPLTTIRQPIREMARAAIQAALGLTLDQRVRDEDEKQLIFPHHFVERESCSCPSLDDLRAIGHSTSRKPLDRPDDKSTQAAFKRLPAQNNPRARGRTR